LLFSVIAVIASEAAKSNASLIIISLFLEFRRIVLVLTKVVMLPLSHLTNAAGGLILLDWCRTTHDNPPMACSF
jgi:uncharacterized membrane protein